MTVSVLDQQQLAGEAAADAWVKQNPTIDAVRAELDRLLWGQRDPEIGPWLSTREGSFYRSRLGLHLTTMQAAERKLLFYADQERRRAEDAAALAQLTDNSVEARLARIEAVLLRRLGEAL